MLQLPWRWTNAAGDVAQADSQILYNFNLFDTHSAYKNEFRANELQIHDLLAATTVKYVCPLMATVKSSLVHSKAVVMINDRQRLTSNRTNNFFILIEWP